MYVLFSLEGQRGVPDNNVYRYDWSIYESKAVRGGWVGARGCVSYFHYLTCKYWTFRLALNIKYECLWLVEKESVWNQPTITPGLMSQKKSRMGRFRSCREKLISKPTNLSWNSIRSNQIAKCIIAKSVLHCLVFQALYCIYIKAYYIEHYQTRCIIYT